MGLEITDDYHGGAGCASCFDVANLFGWQKRPDFILFNVSGIELCPLETRNPNGYFGGHHIAGCYFNGTYNNFWYQFWFDVVLGLDHCALVEIDHIPTGHLAFWSVMPICTTFFLNQVNLQNCIPGQNWKNGQCTISWGPGVYP